MPTYNDREEFLRLSIESILNQSYNNLELIIADDSTAVNSKNVIDEYAIKDSRIRVIRCKKRMGVCGALNKAIIVSKGDYIAHMDADDISLPDRLSTQMKCFTSDEIGVVGGQTYNINEVGSPIGEPTSFPLKKEQNARWLNKGIPQISHPTSIIKKKIFEEIGGYEELYRCSEDYDIWYRIHILGYGFVNVPQVVLQYRVHGDNAHVKFIVQQAKLCSITRVKYVTGVFRRLTEQEFARLTNLVEQNKVCSFTIRYSTPDTLIARIVWNLHLYPTMQSLCLFLLKLRRKRLYKEVFG